MEGEVLLDRIEQERLYLRPGDLEALRKFVTCWRPVTELQRKSLGLDEPQEKKPRHDVQHGVFRGGATSC